MLEVTDELYEEFKRFNDEQATSIRMFRSYGMHKIVNQYLDLPSWFPIDYLAYLEHGITYNEGKSSVEIDSRLNRITSECILLNNKMRSDACKEVLNKDAYTLGATFIHYRAMHEIEQDADAKGTLVFPSHSTPYVDVVFDYGKYADQILNLPEQYHPIHVCVYWKDILMGQHEPFEKRGIPVYTCGHLADENFAHNLYHLLKRYKYITSNHVGSYAVYGLEMGIPFFLYGVPGEVVFGEDSGNREEDQKTAKTITEGSFFKSINVAFTYPQEVLKSATPTITTQQLEFYNQIIDKENWDSKETIRKYILKNMIPILVKKIWNALVGRFTSSKT